MRSTQFSEKEQNTHIFPVVVGRGSSSSRLQRVLQTTPSFTNKQLCRHPAAQYGVAKSDFSPMSRSSSDLFKKEAEHFARIDLDLKKNATNVVQRSYYRSYNNVDFTSNGAVTRNAPDCSVQTNVQWPHCVPHQEV